MNQKNNLIIGLIIAGVVVMSANIDADPRDFVEGLPNNETPETTEGYQGFFHLHNIQGKVEKTVLNYIIRDHDSEKFKNRKNTVMSLVNDLNKRFNNVRFDIEIQDQYYNMKERVTPMMHIVDIAEEAMKALDIKPVIKPIRGGTDGSQLSYMGLPCPNIFAGGHNFHGRYEYIPLESILSATKVICKIATLTQKRYQ